MRTASLTFRAVIAVAALGMMASALILLAEAGENIATAARAAISHSDAHSAISLVMKAIDECLFAIILILLGAKVAATFVISEHAFEPDRVPKWIRPSDVGELKSTFCQAILVYLIVDFATDMATVESKLDPGYLVLPLAILIIAAALRLMPHGGGSGPH
ncbi:YqhA family protein [Bosea sp. PAMC 26642]|uniref:YqhA family protein n=1 Tax=Bosea sp. (strain PAMC 26642) TaxID=1792307 RepID=UPI0007704783|nr:YqhA family protein [Bosea sp. PAMC 26642]AMJ58952.1 hypothetical protein AXW83_00345 [Bosea sp. PAMC 26642]